MQSKGSSASSLLVIALSGEGALALCTLDAETGGLTLLEKVPLPGVSGGCGGMPLAVGKDGDRVFAAWRGEGLRVFSFALNGRAQVLEYLSDASLPASMCYAQVASCGRLLLTSSYTGSTIALSPLDPDGKVGAPVLVQEASHAHCLVEAPNGFFYATSLKGDFVQRYAFDEARRTLRPVARHEMTAGSGPRHIVFSSDGLSAYLLSEFSGAVTRFDVAPETGALASRQIVHLLPEGDKAWAAELRLGPDERTLYASERNSSQIFGFHLSEDRGMQSIGSWSAPDCPRAFSLDASGDYLIALGEKNGEAWSYRIEPDGTLDVVAQLHVGAAPSWVLAAKPSQFPKLQGQDDE